MKAFRISFFFCIYTYYTFIIWLAMISTTTSQGCRSGSIKRHFSRPLVPPSALWPPDNKVWNVLFNPVILRHSSVYLSMVEVLYFKEKFRRSCVDFAVSNAFDDHSSRTLGVFLWTQWVWTEVIRLHVFKKLRGNPSKPERKSKHFEIKHIFYWLVSLPWIHIGLL